VIKKNKPFTPYGRNFAEKLILGNMNFKGMTQEKLK